MPYPWGLSSSRIRLLDGTQPAEIFLQLDLPKQSQLLNEFIVANDPELLGISQAGSIEQGGSRLLDVDPGQALLVRAGLECALNERWIRPLSFQPNPLRLEHPLAPHGVREIALQCSSHDVKELFDLLALVMVNPPDGGHVGATDHTEREEIGG